VAPGNFLCFQGAHAITLSFSNFLGAHKLRNIGSPEIHKEKESTSGAKKKREHGKSKQKQTFARRAFVFVFFLSFLAPLVSSSQPPGGCYLRASKDIRDPPEGKEEDAQWLRKDDGRPGSARQPSFPIVFVPRREPSAGPDFFVLTFLGLWPWILSLFSFCWRES